MAILLTGGTGKTSTRMVPLLQSANIPYLLASRKATGPNTTKFDWLEPTTWENPFDHKFPNGENISAIYLVSPGIADPAPPMNAFIDFAVEKYGVKRFVLLSGSSAEKGGPHVGKVWEYLTERGLEWCVLRATWFMGELPPSLNWMQWVLV
jgi:festuclavine dehydrogenase